jgi:toxin FitB
VILADTNVVSVLCKEEPDQRVLNWLSAHRSDILISAITIAEMAYGIARLPVGKQRAALRLRLDEIKDDFSNSIVAFSEVDAEAFGLIMARRRALGRPISVPDCQIAATASTYDVPLATRNLADFEHIGLTLINPWSHVAL